MGHKTTTPITAGDTQGMSPEFVRLKDLERLFGIKRGTAYHLLNARKIKGLVLRVTGCQSGIRLVSVQSVREYIQSQLSREVA